MNTTFKPSVASTPTSEVGQSSLPSTVVFSIVTPTLNAARYLRDCLESVQKQRLPGVEIEHLILDGGSADETRTILADFPVRMVPRRPDQGLTEAMTLGYSAAEGHLISFLGADDVLLPGALAAVADVWRRERRDLVVARSRWCSADLKSLGELAPPPHWLTAPIHASLGWNYFGAANCFMSPALYHQMGGFDRSFPRAEDYEFYTRVLARRIPFSRLDRTVCIYRRHGHNESMQGQAKSQREHEIILERYGSRSRWATFCRRYGMKAWVYGRNPAWAYHQLVGKMVHWSTAWRTGRPGE